MPTRRPLLLCALSTLIFFTNAFAQKIPPFYETREQHDPNGTGLFFMGREVAHVCMGGDWLERPQREEEENAELMVDLLQLKDGDVVADIGAGTGYISRKLAKRVGPGGIVYAEEIQKEMLATLTNKAVEAGITNIRPVLGTVTDPKLPEASVDLAILVDVYHEFDRPYEMVQNIGKALKPGGRIVFVEYRAEDPNVPIKAVHKMTVEQVKKEMSVHPLTFVASLERLPWQHIIVFRKFMPPLATPREFNGQKFASLEEVLASKRDLWGEAAIRQPDGPGYEFFQSFLPPLRYVNTAFRHYPIVLSAPGATNKARLVSNGSAVNARAELRYVWHEVGTPVTFSVGTNTSLKSLIYEPGRKNRASGEQGEAQNIFGADLTKLTGPTYEKGYLPIVHLSYEHEGTLYEQESFVAVDDEFAQHAAVFVQFKLKNGKPGLVTAKVDSTNQFTFSHPLLQDETGAIHILAEGWEWNATNKTFRATLTKDTNPTLIIATAPLREKPFKSPVGGYAVQRKKCIETWENLLSRGAQIETPEPIVNNAWRALLISIFEMLKGDAPNYSAGNQYERLYEAECGDTARATLLFGQLDSGKKMVVPCLDYARKGLYFHQAAFKLQLLAHYYWLTRDKTFVREMQPRWSKEVQRLIEGREKDSGLLPKEQYAGDIFEDVYTLNSNANGSKALRDMAAVLADIGETNEASRIGDAGNQLRKATLAAVEKSIFTNTTPPFIPLALFGYEKPYDRITDSKLGSYWNEMAPYVLCSDLFGLGSERETQMLEYQYEHGGICMGMVRFHQHSGLFANEYGVDDLYTLRHTEKLLQRDEVERALVSFYGKLAHGFTRDTFIGAEGTSLRALDEFGRPMFLPPNSTAAAFWLWTLRGLLVQDIDSDDDCKPDTLRLCFATPKRWLEDGKTIKVERAPTAFGEVSFEVTSHLKKGELIATVTPPKRNQPKQTLLRIRVPDGWKVMGATAGGKTFKADEKGTVDISEVRERTVIQFKAKRV